MFSVRNGTLCCFPRRGMPAGGCRLPAPYCRLPACYAAIKPAKRRGRPACGWRGGGAPFRPWHGAGRDASKQLFAEEGCEPLSFRCGQLRLVLFEKAGKGFDGPVAHGGPAGAQAALVVVVG